MSSEKFYQLALSLIPGIGNVLTKQLISYCGSANEVFKCNKTKLSKIPGIGEKMAQAILNHDTWKLAEEELHRHEAYGLKLLYYTDPDYPVRLKHIADAPPMLYYNGQCDLNQPKVLAIVGTRKATSYGKEVVEQLIAGMVKHAPLIVSGLAYGIDICAHRSAIKHGLPTIGVLASGINVIYPPAHKDAARQMLNRGGLLSENRLDAKPDFHRFPERNRIIAGMADATLVIEAAEKGGALITAALAKTYKRKLFALPGSIQNPFSRGCLDLIKSGKAEMLTSIEDLETSMGWTVDQEKSMPKASYLESLSTVENSIVQTLQEHDNEMIIDELSWKSQVPINKLAGLLLEMEFKGYIKSLPGKKFRLRI